MILFEPASGILISADALWESGFGVVFPEIEGTAAFDEVAATLDVIERLQRSFDESFAFLRLFGYVLCPSVRMAFKSAVGLTQRDLKFAKSSGLWRTHPWAVVRMPLDNLMRTLGHYFGGRGMTLPRAVRNALSWDHKLMAGLRRSQNSGG